MSHQSRAPHPATALKTGGVPPSMEPPLPAGSDSGDLAWVLLSKRKVREWPQASE